MRKLNMIGVSALLAVAVVVGTIAATKSVALGTTQKQASDAAVRARAQRLDAFERSLRRALAQETPALPRVPKVPSPAQLARVSSAAAAAPQQAPPPKVVYRRPPPVVVAVHRSHDDGGESESGEHTAGGEHGGHATEGHDD